VTRRALRRLPGLTLAQWTEIRDKVTSRDLINAYYAQPAGTPWSWVRTASPCVARFLDPFGSGHCSGAITLDHVKCQPAMSQKAPDNERHLVSICRGHHIDTRAGAQWATANRPLLRDYLIKIYGECSECE
jgi:hypothetical protein